MTLDEIRPLARRCGPRHGFLIVDVRHDQGSNARCHAFDELGFHVSDRLDDGPLAFHFTEAGDARDTMERVLQAAACETAARIAGEVTLVTGTDETRCVLGAPA